MTTYRIGFSILLALSLAACDDDSSGSSGGGTDGGSTTTGASASASNTQTPTTEASMTEGSMTDPSTTGPETTGPQGSSSSSGDVEDSSSSGELGSSSGSSSGGEESSSSGNQKGMADLDMNHPDVIADTQSSIYTETVNFSAQACAVQDGCLTEAGERRLLRFDTITPNVGTADFFAGNAKENPELFEYSECQGQYVLANYARYRLLNADGEEVGNGHKSAFALIDLAPFLPGAGPAQYGFNGNMGISVGWADIYSAGLDCQWVDITDVPAGDYVLELDINPEQVIDEASFDNNILQLDVTITDDDTGGGGGGTPAPDDWTCPAGYYDALDGCDCGCGVLDPDCVDDTVESCEYCEGPGSCADETCSNVAPEDNSQCL